MNKDLIGYAACSVLVAGSIGFCTWRLEATFGALGEHIAAIDAHLDTVDKRLFTANEGLCTLATKAGAECAFDLATARPVQTACAATDPPSWCKDPVIAPTPAALAE